MSDPWIKGWMGKYPRKGADWSPEEDAALMRAYESGRYLNKEIAARHLREPVAIERRLDSLRRRRDIVARYEQARSWASERETAQRALDGIRKLFMYGQPRARGKSRLIEELQIGDVFEGRVITARSSRFVLEAVPLRELPPEIAQALQFGGES